MVNEGSLLPDARQFLPMKAPWRIKRPKCHGISCPALNSATSKYLFHNDINHGPMLAAMFGGP
jgi:hypothetical protein